MPTDRTSRREQADDTRNAAGDLSGRARAELMEKLRRDKNART